MNQHFILKPGDWIGEGKITFSTTLEKIRFFTKWNIGERQDATVSCQQRVEMEEGAGTVHNDIIFFNITDKDFSVELTSDQLQGVQGKGLLDPKTIAWEYRGHPEFEGYEVYELQDDGDYLFHAEYVTLTPMRTIIDGRIWRKSL